MKTSWLSGALVGSLLVGVLSSGVAFGVPVEPTASTDYRALRPDYVRTWYIYNDSNTNGILDPGDTKVAAFDNWWLVDSSHTQHNYTAGPYDANGFTYGPGDDMSSAPMNFASHTDATKNYWLPLAENEIHFYMTYSQFDNNDFAATTVYDDPSLTADEKAYLLQRNMYRNGWGMGWVTSDIKKDANYYMIDDQSTAGRIKMDVFVHDGQAINGSWIDANSVSQVSRSNPQVSVSNDISYSAQDFGGWHPPDYTDPNGNDVGYIHSINDKRFPNPADLATVASSMEFFETDPNALGASDVIHANRRPTEIFANLTDGNGNPYEYQDAFLRRDPNDHSTGAPYTETTNDGGVIAGLSGYDYYDLDDPNKVNDWGEQQVIRVDMDASVFQNFDGEINTNGGDINRVVFYDFGYDPNSGQVTPIEIFLDLANTNLFPENRFYIAQVEMIPEPATIALLTLGSVALLARRRRKAR